MVTVRTLDRTNDDAAQPHPAYAAPYGARQHPNCAPRVVCAQSIPEEHHASVQHLAASYRGWVFALECQDSQELVFWGRALLADQANSGVSLYPGAVIESTVRTHAERLKRRGLN